MIVISCSCGQQLRVQDDAAGKRARCPSCQALIDIPAVLPSAPPELPGELPGESAGEAERVRTRGESPPPLSHAGDRPERRKRRDDRDDWDDREDDRRRRRRRDRDDEDDYLDVARTAPSNDSNSSKATAALVCGILSVVCAPIFGPIGIVVGLMARAEGKRRRIENQSNATVGLILSSCMTLLTITYTLTLIPVIWEVKDAFQQAQQVMKQAQQAQLAAQREAERERQQAEQQANEEARHKQSQNNVKQVAIGMHNYHDEWGHLPSPQATVNRDKSVELSWRVSLLGFIDQGALFKQFHMREEWDSKANIRLLDRMPPPYLLPHTGQKAGQATYLQTFTGPGTPFPKATDKVRFDEFPDGTANTFLFAQSTQSVPWSKPGDMQMPAKNSKLPLPDHFLAAFADGHVRMIDRTKINDEILRNLINPKDGKRVPIWDE